MAIRDDVKEEIKKQQLAWLDTHRLNGKAMEKVFLLCDMIEMFDNEMDELESFQYVIDESGRHAILAMSLWSFLLEDEEACVGGISKQTYTKYIVNADGLQFDQDSKGRLRIQHLVQDLWIPTEEWAEWQAKEGSDESNTTENP